MRASTESALDEAHLILQRRDNLETALHLSQRKNRLCMLFYAVHLKISSSLALVWKPSSKCSGNLAARPPSPRKLTTSSSLPPVATATVRRFLVNRALSQRRGASAGLLLSDSHNPESAERPTTRDREVPLYTGVRGGCDPARCFPLHRRRSARRRCPRTSRGRWN